MFFVKEVDLRGDTLFVNMPRSSFGDTRKVNQLLLGGFKIQEVVKMYIHLPGYYDFRGFDFPNGAI